MLDQQQPTSPFPSLAALLAHPEFCAGVEDAPEVYEDNDECLSTEAEMIDVVERNLTHRVRTRDRWLCQLIDTEPPSYLYTLGLVVGLINEGCLHVHELA